MSAARGPMSDAGLNLLLDHWLAEGPDTAPDRLIDGAIQAATATTQRRWRGRLVRMVAGHSPAVPVGLTAVGIAAVVLSGIGLSLLDTQPGGEQPPSPSVDTGFTPGLSLYRNDEDGYQLLVPDAWEARTYDSQPDGVRMFGSALDQSYPALTVSIGRPDGTFYICRTARCEAVQATTVDELDAVLQAKPPQFTQPEVHGDTRLGVSPARIESFNSGATVWGPVPAFRYVYTVHEGRPVVLAFDHWLIRCPGCGGQFPLSSSILDEIIDSFDFLESFGEPPPAAGDELEFPGHGVAVTLGGLLRDAKAVDRSTIEIAGFTGLRAVILIGDDDGRVRTCVRRTGPWEDCRFLVARSLAELEAAITPRVGEADDHGIRVPIRIGAENVQLAGEEAKLIIVMDYEYPAGSAESITYVLAMHDGRPFVLRFYTPANEQPRGPVDEFLATFRFLD